MYWFPPPAAGDPSPPRPGDLRPLQPYFGDQLLVPAATPAKLDEFSNLRAPAFASRSSKGMPMSKQSDSISPRLKTWFILLFSSTS